MLQLLQLAATKMLFNWTWTKFNAKSSGIVDPLQHARGEEDFRVAQI